MTQLSPPLLEKIAAEWDLSLFYPPSGLDRARRLPRQHNSGRRGQHPRPLVEAEARTRARQRWLAGGWVTHRWPGRWLAGVSQMPESARKQAWAGDAGVFSGQCRVFRYSDRSLRGLEGRAEEDCPLILKREISCYVSLKKLRTDKPLKPDTEPHWNSSFIQEWRKVRNDVFPPAVSFYSYGMPVSWASNVS